MASEHEPEQHVDSMNLDVFDEKDERQHSEGDARDGEASGLKSVDKVQDSMASQKNDDESSKGNDNSEPDDPPLESVDLPELTFDDPAEGPELSSVDLPEVTYGSAGDQPDLQEADLPELTFGSSDVIESVEEQTSDLAVVFEDDDQAVVLDDSASEPVVTDVSPAPDYPGSNDSDTADDGQDDNPWLSYSYEIAVNPAIAALDLTLVYASDNDEDEDDMGGG